MHKPPQRLLPVARENKQKLEFRSTTTNILAVQSRHQRTQVSDSALHFAIFPGGWVGVCYFVRCGPATAWKIQAPTQILTRHRMSNIESTSYPRSISPCPPTCPTMNLPITYPYRLDTKSVNTLSFCSTARYNPYPHLHHQ